MDPVSRDNAVDASRQKEISAGELSASHMGQAFIHIYQQYFIVGIEIKDERIEVTALAVDTGRPSLRTMTYSRSEKIQMLPDLCLALFTPNRVDDDAEKEIESISLSLPSNPYLMPPVASGRPRKWSLENPKNSSMVLKSK